MSFNQKIAERMQKLHLTKAQLAKKAGIPYTTLDSMLKRDSDQKRMESMLRIARILGTTVEELVADAGSFSDAAPSALSPSDRAFLEQYRALDERGKAAVCALMSHEAQQCAPEEETPVYPFLAAKNARRLRVYDLPAAAGSALPLVNEDYTLRLCPEAPAGTDFGIRISGDSMEPNIRDGSLVWVHRQEELGEGEIGIFLLNGEALCKHLGHQDGTCVLLSDNPRYAPIPVLEDDDLRVVGKVLL